MAETFLYEVSIHALLAECDFIKGRKAPERESFNPRTPCGVRRMTILASSPLARFQSTHSLRSATKTPSYFVYDDYVSIHALLAECDVYATGLPASVWSFNPRTPCGVRQFNAYKVRDLIEFQSTHSLRSATCISSQSGHLFDVSIHALLAEGDGNEQAGKDTYSGFNPRTPCGVRQDIVFYAGAG